tara:strand:- start:2017 stop:2280 length:264 start_codon:yes stop_codon:yes gene_type:complete
MKLEDIKFKRPSSGYETKNQRNHALWSGVSEYVVFYKNEPVGSVWKSQRYNTVEWRYEIFDGDVQGSEATRFDTKFPIMSELTKRGK